MKVKYFTNKEYVTYQTDPVFHWRKFHVANRNVKGRVKLFADRNIQLIRVSLIQGKLIRAWEHDFQVTKPGFHWRIFHLGNVQENVEFLVDKECFTHSRFTYSSVFHHLFKCLSPKFKWHLSNVGNMIFESLNQVFTEASFTRSTGTSRACQISDRLKSIPLIQVLITWISCIQKCRLFNVPLIQVK